MQAVHGQIAAKKRLTLGGVIQNAVTDRQRIAALWAAVVQHAARTRSRTWKTKRRAMQAVHGQIAAKKRLTLGGVIQNAVTDRQRIAALWAAVGVPEPPTVPFLDQFPAFVVLRLLSDAEVVPLECGAAVPCGQEGAGCFIVLDGAVDVHSRTASAARSAHLVRFSAALLFLRWFHCAGGHSYVHSRSAHLVRFSAAVSFESTGQSSSGCPWKAMPQGTHTWCALALNELASTTWPSWSGSRVSVATPTHTWLGKALACAGREALSLL